MSYVKSALLDEKGFVILDSYDQAADPEEWKDLEFVDWKSSGDTRFAPLASTVGEIEVNGFWNHIPPRTDKDGVWIASQVAKAPHLIARATEPGSNVGRCRVIELQPNVYSETLYNLHQDDNNRLNPDGSGWIVRGFFNLTDDADSFLTLREDRFDPTNEVRIALPAGTQVIVDTQRFWQSGPLLDAYIEKHHGTNVHENPYLAPELIEAAEADVQRRLAERAAALATRGRPDEGPLDPEA
jgi:hypothetical protein